jgi:putative tricarboxylic transport membrane protein
MCAIGACTISNDIMMFDVWTLFIFGLFGWLALNPGLAIAPFIIGFTLGPSAKIYFVKCLESFGGLTIFIAKSWIAAVMLVLIAGSVAGSIALARKARRVEAVS